MPHRLGGQAMDASTPPAMQPNPTTTPRSSCPRSSRSRSRSHSPSSRRWLGSAARRWRRRPRLRYDLDEAIAAAEAAADIATQPAMEGREEDAAAAVAPCQEPDAGAADAAAITDGARRGSQHEPEGGGATGLDAGVPLTPTQLWQPWPTEGDFDGGTQAAIDQLLGRPSRESPVGDSLVADHEVDSWAMPPARREGTPEGRRSTCPPSPGPPSSSTPHSRHSAAAAAVVAADEDAVWHDVDLVILPGEASSSGTTSPASARQSPSASSQEPSIEKHRAEYAAEAQDAFEVQELAFRQAMTEGRRQHEDLLGDTLELMESLRRGTEARPAEDSTEPSVHSQPHPHRRRRGRL